MKIITFPLSSFLCSSLLGNYMCPEHFLNMSWPCAVQVRASYLVFVASLFLSDQTHLTKNVYCTYENIYENMKDLLAFFHFFKYVNGIQRYPIKC